MKTAKIKIPIYDWELMFCHMDAGDDPEIFIKASRRIGIEPGDCVQFSDLMSRGAMGGGMCYVHSEERKLVVLIYPTLTPENFYSTVGHEIYHCVYAIADHAQIKDEEASAYLIGYIWEKLYKTIQA